MAEKVTSVDIISQHGLSYDPEFNCLSNALVNAVRIKLHEPTHPFPPIYFLTQVLHAYLLYQDVALNGGVTASWAEYPDYPVRQVVRTGVDRTQSLIDSTLNLFYSPEGKLIPAYDPNSAWHQPRLALETAFVGRKIALALECLKLGSNRQ